MLFFVQTAIAASILGWPCQRLNWAWRNVWVTCSINAFVPAAASNSYGNGGFQTSVGGPTFLGVTGATQVNAVGVFVPQATSAVPNGLCAAAPNSGGSFMRNRCRRMLDVYGNLVALCKSPAKSGAVSNVPTGAMPNGGTPDFAPQVGAGPHSDNVVALAMQAQACLTPGTAFPTPVNTCPGLQGWFTVVWNACAFATGTASPLGPQTAPAVPALLGPATTNAPWSLTSPLNFCGSGAPIPPNGASVTTTSATSWNVRGPMFKTTRCRKALDQFGRTASRCGAAPQFGNTDPLRFLAVGLIAQGAACNAAPF